MSKRWDTELFAGLIEPGAAPDGWRTLCRNKGLYDWAHIFTDFPNDRRSLSGSL